MKTRNLIGGPLLDRAGRVRLRHLLYPVGFVFAFGIIVASAFARPSAVVAISVEGQSFQLKTHGGKVETVLHEAGIELGEEDLVSPPLNARIGNGDAIIIKKQKSTLTLNLPEKTVTIRTAADTVREALAENAVVLAPDDLLLRDGQPGSLDDLLVASPITSNADAAYVASTPLRPYGEASYRGGRRPTETNAAPPVTLQIRRPVPIQIHETELSAQVFTKEETLGRALSSAGIALNPADLVTPGVDAKVQAGMHVYIQRTKGVAIQVDGAEHTVRTFSETVGQVLAEKEIKLGELDRIEPELDSYVHDGASIKITRVAQELITTEEAIPFSSEVRADTELEIDHQAIVQTGKPGLFRRTTRVVYENGEETERVFEREWVESEPQAHITAYGTKIVVRELNTPDGPISYWRKLRVYATAYDASGGGKPRSSPGYGYTSIGMKAGKGVIAVDPTVISYYTRMYVPGYGIGIAGDTGGGVRGRFIDLGYEEGDIHWGQSRYLDIYLLTPPPGSVRWIMP